MNTKPSTSQQGIALILCLILSAVFAAISIYNSEKQQQQLQIFLGLQEKVHQQSLAHSLMQKLHFTILSNSEFKWSGQTVRLNGFSKPIKLENPMYEQGSIELKIQNSAGLFSVTSMQSQLLQFSISNLTKSTEQAEQVVDAWLDWEDSDSFTRLNGKEKDAFSTPPYLPRNNKMQLLAEVGLLAAMNNDLYQKLLVHFQYLSPSDFNAKYASNELRALLDLPPLDTTQRTSSFYMQKNGLIVEEKQAFRVELDIRGEYSRFQRKYVVTYRPDEIRLISISEFGD